MLEYSQTDALYSQSGFEKSDEFVKSLKIIAQELVRKDRKAKINQEKQRRITSFVMEGNNLCLTTITQVIEKDSPVGCKSEDEIQDS
jgi:hypothetical protein